MSLAATAKARSIPARARIFSRTNAAAHAAWARSHTIRVCGNETAETSKLRTGSIGGPAATALFELCRIVVVPRRLR